MKHIILAAVLCTASIPAFAFTGGLAPGQTLASRPMMTPGGTVTGAAASSTTTTQTTTMTTNTDASTSMTNDDFQRRKEEMIGSLAHRIGLLQGHLQCAQAATDGQALSACERE